MRNPEAGMSTPRDVSCDVLGAVSCDVLGAVCDSSLKRFDAGGRSSSPRTAAVRFTGTLGDDDESPPGCDWSITDWLLSALLTAAGAW